MPVLILGGTVDKREALARAVHWTWTRQGLPFMALDCGRDTPTLRRAFAIWAGPVPGRRSANPLAAVAGGTLFLDGVESLPAPLQERLLLLLRRTDGDQALRTADLPAWIVAGSRLSTLVALRRNVGAGLLDRLRVTCVRIARTPRLLATGPDAD